MKSCKKYIIATCFTLMFPVLGWSEAPVVDDSENFAALVEQERNAPVLDMNDDAGFEVARNERYPNYRQEEDAPALAREEANSEHAPSNAALNDSAKMIEKVQNLQREVQELRGQLEVQAHELKLLQEQQVAFYKDLDARLGAAPAKVSQSKPSLDISPSSPTYAPSAAKTLPKTKVASSTVTPVLPSSTVSRANPADEQISYLAAYELVSSRRYDDAVSAMHHFVQKYPRGGYTANAEYWLGELYLVKKEYSKAIEHFAVVLDKFPSSSKSAASLLKTGYAFEATGDHEQAKQRFRQVLKTYPGTSPAKMAKAKLEAIDAV
jgi:tol-pal system protein YbgF